MSRDARGRARLCGWMGGVLAVLARGSLFDEERPRALVARAVYQGGDRCHRDRLYSLGSVSRARPQHRSVACWHRACPLRPRVGLRDLGPHAHRAQLGHPDDAEGRARAGDQRPVPPGSSPDLLGHPSRGRRHRGGAELAVVDRRGPSRRLLRLQRDGRGALSDQAVPRQLPRVQAFDQDAPFF
jgi:hypothetical protein